LFDDAFRDGLEVDAGDVQLLQGKSNQVVLVLKLQNEGRLLVA